MADDTATQPAPDVDAIILEFLYQHSSPLDDQDMHLLARGKSEIDLRYDHGWHQLYAVGLDENGDIVDGLQHDEPSGDASGCAEFFAIHSASKRRRKITKIVAVHKMRPDEGGEVHVVPPCGTCRIRMFHHNPEMQVIIYINGKHKEHRKIGIKFLYPAPTKQRHRNSTGVADHQFQL